MTPEQYLRLHERAMKAIARVDANPNPDEHELMQVRVLLSLLKEIQDEVRKETQK